MHTSDEFENLMWTFWSKNTSLAKTFSCRFDQ